MIEHLEIEVTQDMIDRGVPFDGCRCPIQIALNEHPGTPETFGHSLLIVLPDQARRFIKRFDMGFQVKPFSFLANVVNVREGIGGYGLVDEVPRDGGPRE